MSNILIQNSPSLFGCNWRCLLLGTEASIALHEQAGIWISWCCRMFGIKVPLESYGKRKSVRRTDGRRGGLMFRWKSVWLTTYIDKVATITTTTTTAAAYATIFLCLISSLCGQKGLLLCTEFAGTTRNRMI